MVLPSVGFQTLPLRAQTAPAPASPVLPAPEALPLAPEVKGPRPKSNPSVLAPAAKELPPALLDLKAPNPLALPVKPSQVRIRELRPLGLADVETLVEVNNPELKAIASQVEQAQSALRAQIALWYPTIQLNANSLPTYTGGQQFSSAFTGTGQEQGNTITSIWRMQAVLQASWGLINPTRTPQIAAARDRFEQAKNQYLIGLRTRRLEAAEAFFNLQVSDETVRIGQESVRSSLVSLRDAKARFQAGVATKLEVLEAETQLARDQQVLTQGLADQAIARRALAALLDLPQDVTPTSKEPSRVVGSWLPSLQESIIAAYAFREELDNVLLNISIANSEANTALGQVQPFLNIAYGLTGGRTSGVQFANRSTPGVNFGNDSWSVENTVGLNLSWSLFDGGAARANYRRQKQVAQENSFRFAQQRDAIRQQVETNFYELEKNNRNITTTSREVISTRESLRLARLRFQAGVTTQREVVDTQRDLTQAEVRWSTAISDYNKALARLRRFTGLDQVGLCQRQSLPATSPKPAGASEIPVEPQPLIPACRAGSPIGSEAMPPGS
ncbi:TolC family protein [Cyanobium sp. Cruz CV13-4-11]|uniref:TolC family protein n=1 Tax=Cyanobium sp. Cruz CV13-4-11 TaxID=2823710 RepID=UPI0020CDB534|nr:TolC family protein [Cyanobium sp. Cruz CV13-4-11]MCP9899807.1 TolC family protein [Cyanobium sp. Cruz CV11-17]MCP9918247.1 TolC family protein [Cyanobium sp. Cruz CV13-4-11]